MNGRPVQSPVYPPGPRGQGIANPNGSPYERDMVSVLQTLLPGDRWSGIVDVDGTLYQAIVANYGLESSITYSPELAPIGVETTVVEVLNTSTLAVAQVSVQDSRTLPDG